MDLPRRIRIGDRVLDRTLARLEISDEAPRPLRRQTLLFLEVLIREAPGLVSKEALLDAVWGRREVSENVVAQVVRELRHAFGDTAQEARYIETRPRQGYRLKVPVVALPEVAPAPDSPTPPDQDSPPDGGPPAHAGTLADAHAPARMRRASRLWLAVAILVLLGAVGLLRWASSPAPSADTDAWAFPEAALEMRPVLAAEASTASSATAWASAAEELFRGDLPALHRAVASARAEWSGKAAEGHGSPGSATARLLAKRWDLLDQLATGQEVRALETVEALLLLVPEDLHLQMLHEELSQRWRAPARWRPLEPWAQGLPAARRLLLEARRAGAMGDGQRQLDLARAAFAAASADATLLRGLAMAEEASALARSQDLGDALSRFETARTLLIGAGWARAAHLVLLQQVGPARRVDRGRHLIAPLQQTLAAVNATTDPALHARLLESLGVLEGVGGNPAQALAHLDAAVLIYEQLDDLRSAAAARNASASALSAAGRLAEVEARLLEARQLARRSGHVDTLAIISGNFALQLWRRGESAAAIAEMQQVITHFEQARRPHDVAQAQHNLATFLRESGRPGEVRSLRELALGHAREAGLTAALATRLQGRAEDHHQRGDLALARQDLQAAMDAYRSLGDRDGAEVLSCIRAPWALDDDEPPGPEYVALADPSMPARADRQACALWTARHLSSGGRLDEALASLRRWADALNQQGHVRLARQASLLGLELSLDHGLASADMAAELARLAQVADSAGDPALARTVATLTLRHLLLTKGVASEPSQLARRVAAEKLALSADLRSQLTLDCLDTLSQPDQLRAGSQLHCHEQAQALGFRGRVRKLLEAHGSGHEAVR